MTMNCMVREPSCLLGAHPPPARRMVPAVSLRHFEPQHAFLTSATPRRSPSAAPATTPAAGPAQGGVQQPLSNAERKAKRAESQRLGKALVTVQLGRSGVTESFLQGVADALNANELVKVRVGGGGEADLEEVAEEIAEAVDAVVVHKVGFTLTLFRDKALPRLPRIVALRPAHDSEGDSGDDSSDEDEGAATRPAPPPEFTIVG